MTPLYIIPARGGSKGIPGKNIATLGGRPLIAYTIMAAREAVSRTGGYVMLSTDSEEIASVARGLGQDVPYMRPEELATDSAGSREMMLHAMDWADAQGWLYDCVVLLQPTSPLRTAGDILGALTLFEQAQERPDMVVSVCPSDDNPYYNLFETDPEGHLHVCKGNGLYTRRQDAPAVWKYNGAVYVVNPRSIRTMAMGEFPRRIPYVMERERSIDIDTPADLEAAARLL